MTITITIPKEMEPKLQRQAEKEQRSVQDVAINLLDVLLNEEDVFPSLEEVVREIQENGQLPQNVRTAVGSLAEALENAPQDPDFDLATWQREWAIVEREMALMNRMDDIVEGRG